MFIKHFIAWMGIKQKLDVNDYVPPLVREGDIWWCSIGENVGVEVSGKGRTFSRPVLILKQFGNQAYFAVPLTSKARFGDWYYQLNQNGKIQTLMLSQARFVSYKRLLSKMAECSEHDYQKVKEAFASLFY